MLFYLPSVLDPGRGRRRIPRDEGDTGLTEEEHARIVEERKRKEQPCRTLFIRNVKVSYETRRGESAHGEVRRSVPPRAVLFVGDGRRELCSRL